MPASEAHSLMVLVSLKLANINSKNLQFRFEVA